MRRRGRLIGAVLVAVLAGALPASANHTGQNDGNDTRGRLDLRAVRFDHPPGPLEWTFITFQEWSPARLFDRGFLVVELETRGDEAIDHLVVVRSEGRELVGTLFRIRSDGSQVEVARVKAGKGGKRTAWVSFALRKLSIGRSRTSYFWAAASTFTGAACPRTCVDRAPDEGMVEQELPAAPSPSPSPSPSG